MAVDAQVDLHAVENKVRPYLMEVAALIYLGIRMFIVINKNYKGDTIIRLPSLCHLLFHSVRRNYAPQSVFKMEYEVNTHQQIKYIQASNYRQ